MNGNIPDQKTGIQLAVVKHDVVRAYLDKLGQPKDGGDYACVVRLHEAMQLCKAPKLGACTTCRGKSHVDLDCCPFCGDSEVNESVIAARGGATPAETRVLDELKELLVAKASKDEATKAKNEAKTRQVAASAAPAQSGGQPLVAVPPGVGVRSRRAQKKAEQQELPMVPASATTRDVPATVDDLDKSVAQIKAAIGRAAESIYDAAVTIFDVIERKLWMQRRGDNDAPIYTTFAQWVTAELGITTQYAYELADLPKFYSREQVQQIGPTKLTLSLRISQEERKRLLESGDLEKMTVREVKAAITQNPALETERQRAALSGKGAGDKPTQGQKKPTGSSTKAATKEQAKRAEEKERKQQNKPRVDPEPLTVVTAVLPSRMKVELFARPKNVADKPVRARSLSDDPVATIVCANGAKIRLTFFVNTEGFLEGTAVTESPAGVVDSDDEGEE